MSKSVCTLVWGLFLLCSCKQLQKPTYLATENLRISGVGFKRSELSADLKFYNPNSQQLQLKSADIDIYIQNRFLGKAGFDNLLNLPPMDTFYVPVKAVVALRDVLPNAVQILLKDSVNLKLDGTVKAGKAGFFKNVAIKYEGRQSLARFLKDSTAR
ncbi:MAG: LEA type 2 family protein [Bacteroidota bacterium]|nr:LEA type 2 family protein [Bacteroidota bacterium]